MFNSYLRALLGSLIFTVLVMYSISCIFERNLTRRPLDFFSVTVMSDVSGNVQLFYDLGTGFNEDNSQRFLVGPNVKRRLSFRLPRGTIQNLRFDPLDRAGTIILCDPILELAGSSDSIDLVNFFPVQHIAHMNLKKNCLTVETVADAYDPILLIKLTQPLNTTRPSPSVTPKRVHVVTFCLLFAVVFVVFLIIDRLFALSTFRASIKLVTKPLFSFLGNPWTIMVFITLIRLWLVSGQTGFAIGGSGHDDELGMKLARNILAINWLGEFNLFTLLKEPFYPIFVAGNFILGFPLLLTQQILYSLACLVVVYSLKPLINSKVALIILFTLLIFHPVSYDGYLASRLYRTSIYPALTLLSIGCVFGIYNYRSQGFGTLALWCTGLGFFFSAFWHNREEGLWLVPAILFILSLTLLKLFVGKPKAWIGRMILCLLPIAIFGMINTSLKTMNYIMYGVFISCDHKEPSFRKAYGSLMRVQPDRWQHYVPVPLETRQEIYAASPAFRELEPFIEGELRGWNVHAKNLFPEGHESFGEFGGGWWPHVLRDAVSAAGYYESGATAASYYARLAGEIDSACLEGRLKCGSPHYSFIPPLRKEYIVPFVSGLNKSWKLLNVSSGFSAIPRESSGSDSQLDLFRDVTRSELSPRLEDKPSNMKFQTELRRIKVTVLSYLGNIYLSLTWWLAGGGFLAYLIVLIRGLYKKRIDDLSLVSSSVLMGLTALTVMLSLADAVWWPTVVNPLYFFPGYSLMILFASLSIIEVFQNMVLPSIFKWEH